MTPITANVPYMVSPGNHDASWVSIFDSGFEIKKKKSRSRFEIRNWQSSLAATILESPTKLPVLLLLKLSVYLVKPTLLVTSTWVYFFAFEALWYWSITFQHFRMPSASSGGVGNMWYSFDHGLMHMISLDTETDLGTFSNGTAIIGPDENGYNGPFVNSFFFFSSIPYPSSLLGTNWSANRVA